MIIAIIVQFIVCILIMKWVLKQKTGERFSVKAIVRFLVMGALAGGVAIAFSMAVSLDKRTFAGLNPFVGGFLTALISAALLEEVTKYIFFRLALIKNKEVSVWLDVIIAALVTGIGFNLFEDITYAMFGDGNIIRAILPMHILFQLIMGYYYGKALVTKQFKYHVLSLVVPILCHTLFDMFPLSLMVLTSDINLDELRNMSSQELMSQPYVYQLFIMIVGTVVVSIAFFVILIIFIRKIGVWSKNGEKTESSII